MKPLSAVLVKQRSMSRSSPHPHQTWYHQHQGPAGSLLSSPTKSSSRPVGKLSSFSAYDDAYGESDFKLPPSAIVPRKKRAASLDKSRYFAIVKEQVEDVDLSGVGFGVRDERNETDFGAL